LFETRSDTTLSSSAPPAPEEKICIDRKDSLEDIAVLLLVLKNELFVVVLNMSLPPDFFLSELPSILPKPSDIVRLKLVFVVT
jgi:hypothetical protein